jgi:hypothetical protein
MIIEAKAQPPAPKTRRRESTLIICASLPDARSLRRPSFQTSLIGTPIAWFCKILTARAVFSQLLSCIDLYHLGWPVPQVFQNEGCIYGHDKAAKSWIGAQLNLPPPIGVHYRQWQTRAPGSYGAS